MKQIKPIDYKLDATHQAQLKAATKQMLELVTKVNQWHEYRLLTASDRQNLVSDGFAQDLVDNLVYLTIRCSHHKVKKVMII